jgi:hypothetical protein
LISCRRQRLRAAVSRIVNGCVISYGARVPLTACLICMHVETSRHHGGITHSWSLADDLFDPLGRR